MGCVWRQDLRELALALQSEVGSLRSQLCSRQATEAELNEHIATLQVRPLPATLGSIPRKTCLQKASMDGSNRDDTLER